MKVSDQDSENAASGPPTDPPKKSRLLDQKLEKRSGRDRRKGIDRRSGFNRRHHRDRRER